MANFSNSRFTLTGESLLSWSTWQDGVRFCHAVAILRRSGNRWVVDNDTAEEVSSDRDWHAKTRASFVADALVTAELGHVPGMGFYRDSKR